jgi:hypothetical protein
MPRIPSAHFMDCLRGCLRTGLDLVVAPRCIVLTSDV